ncbi:MAG: hypothetical protein NVSMB51_13960 [Solirubrobacteraceae bacterium]
MSAGAELATAERALAYACGPSQVTVTRERSLMSRFARSQPTQATAVERTTIDALCVVDGHVGAAAAASCEDDALREVLARANAAAVAAARSAAGASHPGLPAPAAVRPHAGWDAATAAPAPGAAGAALEQVFAGCARHRLEAFGIWTAGEVREGLASTSGVRLADRRTDAHMKLICRAADGRSGYAAETAVAAKAIDAAELVRRACAKVWRGAARRLAPGEYTAVLDHEAVGVLLDFLGVLAFNGLAHVEGRGALSGRLGAAVAAPQINLADSPRYARTLPRSFDADGVPASPVPLIQDGVAHRVVHDLRSAALAGTQSTGHALSPGGAPDGPGPSNLVLAAGGDGSIEELIAGVRYGIYVTRLWYVNVVEPRDAVLTGMTRDGTFLIEDGRLTAPLEDLRFTDSALRILRAVSALGTEQRLVSEAEFYGRREPHGVVCPALVTEGLRVA